MEPGSNTISGEELSEKGQVTPELVGQADEPESKEKISKPTILVPDTWGRSVADSPLEAIFAGMSSPESKAKILAERQLDAEFRQKMIAMGFKVIDRKADQPHVFGEGEYTIRGAEDDIGNESEMIRKVAPDVKISEKLSQREFERSPFLPAVASVGLHGGAGIYLIETEDQLKIFNLFLANDGKQMDDSFEYSPYINTPSDRYTSFRVVVSAKGAILASALFYSAARKSEPTFIQSDSDPEELGELGSNLLDYLENPASRYYLKSKRIISNLASGGSVIPLDPTDKSISTTESGEQILQQHGISDQKLPKILAQASRSIGENVGRLKGLFVGIDYIQDREGNYYYLESNAGPGIGAYLAAKNNGQGTEADGYRMVMEEVLADLDS